MNQLETIELIRTSQSWDGAELPDYFQGRPEIVAMKYIIPQGQKLGWHHHDAMNCGIHSNSPNCLSSAALISAAYVTINIIEMQTPRTFLALYLQTARPINAQTCANQLSIQTKTITNTRNTATMTYKIFILPFFNVTKLLKIHIITQTDTNF